MEYRRQASIDYKEGAPEGCQYCKPASVEQKRQNRSDYQEQNRFSEIAPPKCCRAHDEQDCYRESQNHHEPRTYRKCISSHV